MSNHVEFKYEIRLEVDIDLWALEYGLSEEEAKADAENYLPQVLMGHPWLIDNPDMFPQVQITNSKD